MPTRELLSPAQRTQFLCVPAEMSEQMLARYYTLSDDDLNLIKQHRRNHNRLGFAVQLAYLRFPGRTWAANEEISPLVVSYVANQLKVNPVSIVQYGQDREATRYEHLAELEKVCGFRPFTKREYRELAVRLLPLARKTDTGTVLVSSLIEEMRSRKIIIPALSTVERLGWETRRRTQRLVYRYLTEGLTDVQRTQLKALLTVPAASRQTILVWLRQPPGTASPTNFQKVIERLLWIRSLSLDPQVAAQVHHNRLQQMAREGAHTTAQRLVHFHDDRRDATLVAFLMLTAEELTDAALDMHDKLMAEEKLPDVRQVKGKLVITPLTKVIPNEVEALTQQVYDVLPRIKLPDLLLEVDAWTGFSRHFTHLQSGDPPKDRVVLFAALLADAINLGYSKMADACPGMTFDRLAWFADWYIRDENHTKALAEVINYHHSVPFASHWGDGTTSSSDGQRFKVGGQSEATAQVNLRYGTEPGVTFYTHLSDQYGPYRVKVISSSVRDAPHMIDGLLYHETDLQIHEHYTDTWGYTDQVFGLAHLLGFRFAPRIRDLGNKRMYSIEKENSYPGLEPYLGGSINVKQIDAHWDDLLRLTSSVRKGTVTASLILGKLASYPRQNGLAHALREVGRIEKSLFALEWLQSPELRRRVLVGLNKG